MGLIESGVQKADERRRTQGFFAAIGGDRLAGKSTIAGTLPGRTLIVQPQDIEAGNLSPIELAEKLGNHLDLLELDQYQKFFTLLEDPDIHSYDNIYVDGISAFTKQIYQSPEYAKKTANGNVFDGFRLISDMSDTLIRSYKRFSKDYNKNVFITFATEAIRGPDGAVAEVKTLSKGNNPKKFVEEAAGNVLQIVLVPAEDGSSQRVLFTTTTGPYTARLGDLLPGTVPAAVTPDLKELLTLLGRIG